MLPTPKTAAARRSGDAMAASSRKGCGMGTPSLKLNTYRWKLPERWYQVARTLGKSPQKSSEIANTTPYLKIRMGPFGPGFFNFRYFWPGILERDYQKRRTRPLLQWRRKAAGGRVATQRGFIRFSRDFDIYKTTFQDLQLWAISLLPPGWKCKIKRPVDT